MSSRFVLFLSTILVFCFSYLLGACGGVDRRELQHSRLHAEDNISIIPESYDCEWYWKENGYQQAWDTLATKDLRPGEGITIGLIDTGYLPNPEFMSPLVEGAGVSLPQWTIGSQRLGRFNFV